MAVPVNVIDEAVPEQMVVVPEILAVGIGMTVMTAFPVIACEQNGLTLLVTLTRA